MTMNRVLTLLIEIVDKEQASWIWDAHSYMQPIHGVNVLVIAEGNEINGDDDE